MLRDRIETIEDTDLFEKATQAKTRDNVEKIYVDRLDDLGVELNSDDEAAESEPSEDAEHTAGGSESDDDTDDTENTPDTDRSDSQSEASVDSLSSTLTTTGFDDDPDDPETDTVANPPETDDETPKSRPDSDPNDPWMSIDVEVELRERVADGPNTLCSMTRWIVRGRVRSHEGS